MEKYKITSSKLHQHLAQQKVQQKVHSNYVAHLIKRFVFTKFVCLTKPKHKEKSIFQLILLSKMLCTSFVQHCEFRCVILFEDMGE